MKKRYLEYDLARTLALLPMPISHIALQFVITGQCSAQAGNTVNAINFISSFGACLFMLCMGINLKFAHLEKPADICRRGLKLFVYFAVLNVLRYAIPILTCHFTGHTGEEVPFCFLIGFLPSIFIHSDILNFATLYIFLFALMKKLKLHPLAMVGVTAAMSIIDQLLPNPELANFNLHLLLGNFFFTTDGNASFALMQWSVVPTVGYAFCHYFKQAETKGKAEEYWRKAALVSASTFVLGLLVCAVFKIDVMSIVGNQAVDYNFELLGAVIVMSLVVVFMYLLHVICAKIKDGKLKSFIMEFSASITYYYMLQWIMVFWTSAAFVLLGITSISDFAVFLITVVVIVGSAVIALWYTRQKAAKKAAKAY